MTSTVQTEAICSNSLASICSFDIENLGHGRRERLLQRSHSMADIKIYKVVVDIYVPALAVSENLAFEIFSHEQSIKVVEYNIRNGVNRLQMLKFVKAV